MNILFNFKNLFIFSLLIIVIGFSSISKDFISVEVKGEVNKPGVYKITDEMVVNDILKMAELNDKSDVSQINLSKKLYDEMVIIIPTKAEIKTNVAYKLIENTCICPKLTNDSCLSPSVIKDEIVSNNKISLNTATKEELMSLPGIGEAKALLIIEYRKQNKFNKLEDIMNIKGIGKSIYEKLKDNISL